MRRNSLLFLLAKDEIHSLIAMDDLEQASELLMEVVEIFEESRYEEAILTMRGVKKLQRDQIIGIIDYSTLLKEENLLSVRILTLLKNLKPRSQGLA